MRRELILTLIVCLIISASCIYVSAESENEPDSYSIRGISYVYDSSVSIESFYNDRDISDILSKVQRKILKDNNKEYIALSEYLTEQEIKTFVEKGIDPVAVSVSTIETEIIPEALIKSKKGADTISLTRSYQFKITTLGFSYYKLTASWDVFTPTGECTVTYSSFSHVSGPMAISHWKNFETNRIHSYFTFTNGSVNNTVDYHFRVNSSGNIIQYYP